MNIGDRVKFVVQDKIVRGTISGYEPAAIVNGYEAKRLGWRFPLGETGLGRMMHVTIDADCAKNPSNHDAMIPEERLTLE